MRGTAWLGILVLAAIAGCGGGGGSDGSGGGGVQTSGLLPAAPAVGAVLHADAATLRVLRSGASWTYRGVDKANENSAAATVYTNVVTHASAPAGIEERSSNSLNQGADSTVVRIQSGTVTQALDLGELDLPGPAVDAIELRSPVRANDQYTIYDRRVPDAVEDLDGDSKRETLDVAIWATVKGEEIVDIVQRPGLAAVRVDTTLLVRARLSARGEVTETVRLTQSVWYAAGVGIVRWRSDVPNDNVPTIRHVTTEDLLYWDGVTEGFGPLAAVEAVLPAGGAFAGQPLGSVMDAASFGTHGVLRILQPNQPPVYVVLARIDATGRITDVAQHPHLDQDGLLLFPRAMVGTAGGVRIITRELVGGLVLQSFDSSGQVRLPGPNARLAPAPLASSVDGFDMAAAGHGNRIWIMWLQYLDVFEDDVQVADLVVRAFDAAGAPVAEPVVLASHVKPGSVSSMSLTANSNQAIAAWSELNTGRQYGVFDGTSAALVAFRSLPVEAAYAAPFATENTLGFVQQAGLASGAASRLDAQFDPMLGLGGLFTDELIAPPWARPFNTLLPAFSDPAGLFLAGQQSTQIWPGDAPLGQSLTTVLEVVPGTDALTTSAQVRPLLRQPFAGVGFQMSEVVALDGRVLVMGYASVQQRRVTYPVWR